MSPRAACRLESIGFGDVYDYVGSKMDWIDAGLPFEGTDADRPRLGTLANSDVPTCSLGERVGEVAARRGQWEIVVVVDADRVVLGVVGTEELSGDSEAPVSSVMREGPSTYRPHVPPEELLPKLEKNPRPWVLVTHLDGSLVGLVYPSDLREAAAGGSG